MGETKLDKIVYGDDVFVKIQDKNVLDAIRECAKDNYCDFRLKCAAFRRIPKRRKTDALLIDFYGGKNGCGNFERYLEGVGVLVAKLKSGGFGEAVLMWWENDVLDDVFEIRICCFDKETVANAK